MEEVSTAEGLRRLRHDWNELEAAGEPINPFLSWDWQWSWWEIFGHERRLRCLVVSDAAKVIGLVPLQIASDHPTALGFAGGPDLSDHLGFLFLPQRADEVALAALDHLCQDRGDGRVSALDLHLLLDSSPALVALRRAARQLELGEELTQEEVSPRVTLGGDFEEFLTGQLNKKDRHELRRKLRRLDSERPDWSLVTEAELGAVDAIEAFFPILRASGPHKVDFLTPEVEAFIRSASRRLHERGWLRVQFIKAGGQLIGATLGFTVSGTWNLYNSGYQPDAAALSPGFLCVSEGIRVAIDEGCATADFLRGNEAYKYHLGAVDTPLWRLHISLPGGKESRP